MLISRFKNSQENMKIEDFCEMVKIKLPEQYLNFMRKYNGGETPDTKWTGTGKSDVRVFYGYKIDKKNWDLEQILSYVLMEKLMEQKMFPFAENSFGDVYCINCEDESIWFMHHDSPKGKRVADDFNGFIKGCKSKKIGHIWTIEERKKILFDNWGKEPSEGQLKGWQAEIDKYSNMVQEEVIL